MNSYSVTYKTSKGAPIHINVSVEGDNAVIAECRGPENFRPNYTYPRFKKGATNAQPEVIESVIKMIREIENDRATQKKAASQTIGKPKPGKRELKTVVVEIGITY